MNPMLAWLLRTIRPREGWMTFGLLTTAVLCFPVALARAKPVPRAELWILIALLSLLTATLLSRWRLSNRLGWAAGGLLGLALTFGLAGQVMPSPLQFLGELARTPAWVTAHLSDGQALRHHQTMPPAPLLPLVKLEMAQAVDFAGRIGTWAYVALTGSRSHDTDIFLWLIGLAVWLITWHAGWCFRRQRSGLAALWPAGAALANAVIFAGEGLELLLTYLGATVLLVTQGQFLAAVEAWEREGIDYSPEIRLDVTLVSLALAGGIVATAWFVPVLASPRTAAFVARALAGPWQRVDRLTDRLFAGVERPAHGLGAAGGVPFHDLPLSRALGGPPDLRDVPVLLVWTSDPPPSRTPGEPPAAETSTPKRYWRGQVYDVYTGHGWAASPVRRQAGQVEQLDVLQQSSGDLLLQRYTILAPGGDLRYAVNEPLAADRPFTREEGEGGELLAIRMAQQGYSVLSRPPAASIAELRAAPTDYPGWVRQRYLVLPEIPERVAALAQSITRNTPTPYDKALALESYLRSLPYNLQVPVPPKDRDVVDYFLFDLRQGYCDYFATAMVVMARAVGLPARLATGYATGRYDPRQDRYVVTAMNAHAWVEIYFPGHGWIEFEPTPARSIFTRPEQGSTSQAASAPATSSRHLPLAGPGSLAMPALLALLTLAAWLAWRGSQLRRAPWPAGPGGRRLPPADRVRQTYYQMCDWARRLGWGPQADQTPHEYVAALSRALAGREVHLRWLGREVRWSGSDGARALTRLGDAFVEARYSAHVIPPDAGEAASTAWRRVRRALPLLLLRRS